MMMTRLGSRIVLYVHVEGSLPRSQGCRTAAQLLNTSSFAVASFY